MRSFIAIDLPAAEQQALGKAVQSLCQSKVRASWVRAENLHLTLKFLGDIDPVQLAGIIASLEPLAAGEQPFCLQFGEFGFFPPRGQPRIVYLSVEPESFLKSLANRVDELLLPLGFPRERRFRAHVTLARLKSDKNLPQLFKALGSSVLSGEFRVAGVTLYQSTLFSDGARYEVLRRFPFGR